MLFLTPNQQCQSTEGTGKKLLRIYEGFCFWNENLYGMSSVNKSPVLVTPATCVRRLFACVCVFKATTTFENGVDWRERRLSVTSKNFQQTWSRDFDFFTSRSTVYIIFVILGLPDRLLESLCYSWQDYYALLVNFIRLVSDCWTIVSF